jgi:nucleotide-binding universal stress UspA family protein
VRLLAAYTPPAALVGGGGYSAAAYPDEERERERANQALEKARDVLGREPDTGKVARGAAWDVLLREAEEFDATVVAVGSHGLRRMTGIFLGSVATEIVHKATCSVLVARPAADGFPRKIVVGVDGSPESAAAYAAADHIAERFGAQLWPVVAHGDHPVNRDAVDAIVDHRRDDLPDHPVKALVAAAAEADLVVVGSRGLHGLKALGSVSERVAHQAGCSVLIVREGDPA